MAHSADDRADELRTATGSSTGISLTLDPASLGWVRGTYNDYMSTMRDQPNSGADVLLCDTGVLLAAGNTKDRAHQACVPM